VTVSWFGTPELAAEDLQKLQAAGLDAYLGGDYHRHHGAVELQVPESQVRRAFEVLEIDPPQPEVIAPRARPICPQCGSEDTAAVPPYAWRIVLATLAIFAISMILGFGTVGIVFVVVGWLVSLRFSRRSGNFRCLRCKKEWKPA
jgi:hypothetical protein